MTRALLALPFWGLLFVTGVQLGTHNGYALAEYRQSLACRSRLDLAEFMYLGDPDILLRAIRVAEGVNSYGVLWLAKRYGSHNAVPWEVGRREAAKIVHRVYRDWKRSGTCVTFLRYLHAQYAPVGVENDPTNLNTRWAENVAINVAFQLVEGSVR